jgi:hypothetical protein
MNNFPSSALRLLLCICRLQLISLPLSELGNTSAIPTVLVDNLSSVCGFGQNEQARDLEYDSDSATIYISTQQCVAPHFQPRSDGACSFPATFAHAKTLDTTTPTRLISAMQHMRWGLCQV